MNERITIEQLIEVLEDAKQDYEKFYNKNVKAASARLRKKVQTANKMIKEMRKQIMDHKETLIKE